MIMMRPVLKGGNVKIWIIIELLCLQNKIIFDRVKILQLAKILTFTSDWEKVRLVSNGAKAQSRDQSSVLFPSQASQKDEMLSQVETGLDVWFLPIKRLGR